MTTKNSTRFKHFDELLAVRMSTPTFILNEPALPQFECEATSLFVDDLLEAGFIFSHEISVENAVGKDEGDSAKLIVYIKADDNAYAIVSDLYHDECWVSFTSFFPDGSRFVTTSQPGALTLEQISTDDLSLTIENAGSAPIQSQWKRHKRFIATEAPEKDPLLYKPVQHTELEKSFYQKYVSALLNHNVLQQSDTQTVRFTRSGARYFHVALTSRSAKRPKPRAQEWITKRKRFTLKNPFRTRHLALAASALVGIGIVAVLLQSGGKEPASSPTELAISAALQPDGNTTVESAPTQLTTAAVNPDSLESGSNQLDKELEQIDRQKYLIADQEDEMWRIAVENAEFFLLSNDGDPAPWVRTARKIAAGFNSHDSRLARTYFLSALLEPDYRIAEQQFNRALSIQTKTLGLYHAETAQTLEALAWISEHNKEDLDEAITYQRLAINIYHDIFGPDSEDTKAAEWKLEYFEDRLAGLRPKANSNRRLLPALARFSR